MHDAIYIRNEPFMHNMRKANRTIAPIARWNIPERGGETTRRWHSTSRASSLVASEDTEGSSDPHGKRIPRQGMWKICFRRESTAGLLLHS